MSKRALESSVDTVSKSKKEDVTYPRDITKPELYATVDAYILSLAPPGSKKTYFEGELTDGEATVRVVGFERKQWEQMDHFFAKKIPVSIINCQIKAGKFSAKMEVVMRGYTKFQPSKMKFDNSKITAIGTTVVSLKDVKNVDEYSRITIRAMVTKVNDPEQVGKGLTKQDLTIADATEAVVLTLWGPDIHKVNLAHSYEFRRLVVRSYRGKFQLSFPRSGAAIVPIDDLEDIAEDSFDLDGDDQELLGAQIMGVNQLESIFSCHYCKRGGIKKTTSNMGSCEQCDTFQRLQEQKITCKLFVMAGEEHYTFRAYEDMLKAIVKKDKFTAEDLVAAPPFNLKYNEYHVVTSVTRM